MLFRERLEPGIYVVLREVFHRFSACAMQLFFLFCKQSMPQRWWGHGTYTLLTWTCCCKKCIKNTFYDLKIALLSQHPYLTFFFTTVNSGREKKKQRQEIIASCEARYWDLLQERNNHQVPRNRNRLKQSSGIWLLATKKVACYNTSMASSFETQYHVNMGWQQHTLITNEHSFSNLPSKCTRKKQTVD